MHPAPPAAAPPPPGRPSPVPAGQGSAPRWRSVGGHAGRWWRGRAEDPAWVRPCLLALLAGTGLLYLVDLGRSGWANAYYSAAVQAADHSWKALWFGSLDRSNFITVDKPPLSLWVMDASTRIFGLSPWSVLAPQALAGVATVGLVYLTVRRSFGAGAALLAGLALALTPVATLMFRFNNPDALLTLLAVGTVSVVLRAAEDGRGRWILAAGALVGLGFLTKYLQTLLVVPPLAGVYLATGPGRATRRIAQLAAGGAAMLAVAASWPATVLLTPAADRPWIGSTAHDNLLTLIFGYTGVGQLSGHEPGSIGFVSSASGGGGAAGVLRMFDEEFRTQVGWLLPAALVGALLLLWWTRRAGRTDRRRAAVLAWGGVLVVSAGAFSLGKGIIHPYYSVEMAPSIAALAGAGAAGAWARRRRPGGWAALTVLLGVTAVWAVWILGHRPPWSSGPLIAVTLLGAGLVWALARTLRRPVATVAGGIAVAVCLAGPLAYSVATVLTDHATAIPTAGPAQQYLLPASDRTGDLLVASRPTPAVTALLAVGAGRYAWAGAVVGGEQAAGYALAAGVPVMDIGGFNGTDDAPSLAAFRRDVADRRIHWFITAGLPPWAGSPASTALDARTVTSWVEHHFRPHRLGEFTLWDLTPAPPAG